jgi:hypothetical protein
MSCGLIHILENNYYGLQQETAEIAAGEPHGKPRIKAVSREELLRLSGI